MGERVPLGARVDEDVISAFRDFVSDEHGQIRGEMGREIENAMIEYMDHDRYARIEEKIDSLPDEIVQTLSESSLDGETKSGTSSNEDSSESSGPNFNKTTRNNLTAIENEIPNDTVISTDLLEAAIENNAGTAYKTVRRYKKILMNRGEIIEHPFKADQFVTSAQNFAVICENSPEVTPPKLRDIIADRMDVLGEEWYLDALPESVMRDTELKVDKVMDTAPYREDHGLALEQGTHDRGVQ